MGRGMSRASKRAKEHQNRSSDELVMAKTRISRSQYLQVTDVREGRMSGASDVRENRKSVNLVRVKGSGRPERSDARLFLGLRTSVKLRSSGGSGSTRDASSGARFWAENGDFGVKIDEISWMERGETWGDARSTRNQAKPGIKSNKTSAKVTNH